MGSDAGSDAGGEAGLGGLPAPTGIKVAFGREGDMVVSWTPLANPDVASYTVLYGTDPAALDKEKTVAHTESFASVYTGLSGRTYHFAVRAVDTAGRVGATSEIVSRTIGLVPATYPAQPGLRYLVRGGDMSRFFQNIHIDAVEGDTYTPVDDAIVKVNDQTIPIAGSGRYYGNLSPFAPEGGVITLSVTIGEDVITATANAPPKPVITSPAEDAVIAPDGDIEVAWTSATDPVRFTVALNCDSESTRVYLPGDARAATISARVMPAGTECNVTVYSYADGTFTGLARLESTMNLREETSPHPIQIAP